MLSPTERVIMAIDGREPDRVPLFSYYLDFGPVQQVLGRSVLGLSALLLNPVSGFFLDRWGKRLKRLLTDPISTIMWEKSIEAAAVLGFDCVNGLYDQTFMVWDARTFARVTGSFYTIVDDGHGNTWYMYRGPAITSPKAFDEWPYFPDPDDLARDAYKFYRRMISRLGEKICIIAQAAFGIHETMLWSLGFEKLPLYIRREPALIKRFVAYLEDLIMKTNMAAMDAGVRVIFNGDDFAFKTGPMMNPKTCDELFGPSYRRITKAVHDRGGRVLLHSCGDNTKMFDYFIDWGFDGGHAYENTSNVDIVYEKRVHGDHFTIVGGVGVDYILTSRSADAEVADEVKRLIRICAPGARFLLGPVHDHPDMDMGKLRLMISAAREYGRYPLDPSLLI